LFSIWAENIESKIKSVSSRDRSSCRRPPPGASRDRGSEKDAISWWTLVQTEHVYVLTYLDWVLVISIKCNDWNHCYPKGFPHFQRMIRDACGFLNLLSCSECIHKLLLSLYTNTISSELSLPGKGGKHLSILVFRHNEFLKLDWKEKGLACYFKAYYLLCLPFQASNFHRRHREFLSSYFSRFVCNNCATRSFRPIHIIVNM